MQKLTRSQVIAHRLRAHNLVARRPPEDVHDVISVCGVQNTPPGGIETAVAARTEGLDAAGLAARLYEERSLAQAWSIRGVPLVFPTAEWHTFTSALIPPPGDPWVYTIGINAALERVEMSFDTLLETARGVIGPVLADGPVPSKRLLDALLAAAMAPRLPAGRREAWFAPSIYGPNQTMGEAIASFLLRPLSFMGYVCFGRREGASPNFVAPLDWLGRRLPPADPDAGRRLAHKYVHAFGPTTVAAFATWLGASPHQARALWATIEAELSPVEYGGKTRFVLADDLPSFVEADLPDGSLRLLGPHDAYLDLPDKETICPDRTLQRKIWKTVGIPGVVLQDGRVAGTWRPATRGRRLALSFELFEEVDADALRREAEGLAAFKGMHLAET